MKVEVERVKAVNAGNLIAYADVCIGGCAIIKGCRVVRGENGVFVSVPSIKGKDDKYYPVIWFKSKEIAEQFSKDAVAGVMEKIDVNAPQETVGAESGWEA